MACCDRRLSLGATESVCPTCLATVPAERFAEGDVVYLRKACPDHGAVVYLADKLVQGETRVSLETRFAPGLDRFAGDPSALAGVRRRLASARAIFEAIEARIGSLAIDDDTALAPPTEGASWPAAIAV